MNFLPTPDFSHRSNFMASDFVSNTLENINTQGRYLDVQPFPNSLCDSKRFSKSELNPV
jgi:hypothetical protein